jgi:CHAD domain-containing protein
MSMPADQKDHVTVRSSSHGGVTLTAQHTSPNSFISPDDAVKFYGIYRIGDILESCAVLQHNLALLALPAIERRRAGRLHVARLGRGRRAAGTGQPPAQHRAGDGSPWESSSLRARTAPSAASANRREGRGTSMGYAFDVDETVPEAVHRITDEQVEQAVSALEEPGDDLEAAVHDCRKRGKKLRGLIRLVRPSLGSAYGRANAAFRDAGRELSALRDAQASLATFDALVAGAGDRLPAGGVGAVRAGLSALAGERARAAADLFRTGRRHVDRAKLGGRGRSSWSAVGPGLERTYRAGRRARAGAEAGGDPATVHEWRKRAKDAWYHVRLLRDAAPSVLGPLADRFHELSDALGDAHDLVVIAERLRATPDRFGGRAQVEAARELTDERRAVLERRALAVGARLYAEKPARYAARLGAYWEAWHDEGDEEPAGGLADLFPPADDLDVLDLDALRDRAGAAALPAHLYPTRAQLLGELRAAGLR